MILAVVVDSGVDGMLIGLAGSVARSSGCLMAIATAIEMGFLGYSFACSLTKVPGWWLYGESCGVFWLELWGLF